MHDSPLVWWVVGLGAVAILLALVFRLSRAARLRRRLKKTHGRIVSKSQRPSVKFSVKLPKE